MIGEKLKQTRIKQGYSQTEVAKETNIYRPTLSKIEIISMSQTLNNFKNL